MISALILATALIAPQQQIDTTFAVQPGGTLEVDAHGGSVSVVTWDRAEVRVVASHDSRTRVLVRSRSGGVSVDVESRRGASGRNAPGDVRYEITVPRSYGARVDGVNLVATIEGLRGDIEVDNVEGTITIRGVTGDVEVESVSGGVLIENTVGSVSTGTVNQGIRLNAVRGDIEAETVNGSIVINAAESTNVMANTVNGLEYDGAVRDGGRYYLGTHNGRITMSVPERTNARVTVNTHSGKVDAAFPVQIGAMREGELSFTVGTGSARVELQSFNGTVHLVRPTGR